MSYGLLGNRWTLTYIRLGVTSWKWVMVYQVAEKSKHIFRIRSDIHKNDRWKLDARRCPFLIDIPMKKAAAHYHLSYPKVVFNIIICPTQKWCFTLSFVLLKSDVPHYQLFHIISCPTHKWCSRLSFVLPKSDVPYHQLSYPKVMFHIIICPTHNWCSTLSFVLTICDVPHYHLSYP